MLMRMMNKLSALLICSFCFFAGCSAGEEEPVIIPEGPPQVVKTNPMKVYMHYMPWFQSKPFSGVWGSHWTMSNKNPDIMDESGKREIAAHYYPLIGPYDSKDPAVIEYHLLLMKYAGVDGLLVDWYGTHMVYDYRTNFNNTNALVDKLDDVGLTFAIVYEDYTAENVEKQTSKTALEAAKADFAYLQEEYFPKDEYISIDDKPLLLTFGPRYFNQSTQWDQILLAINPKPNFIPLWDHAGRLGANAGGQYAWVDFTETFTKLTSFYSKVNTVPLLIGSAYPRFHDFYAEGGWGSSYGFVDDKNGETFSNTLNLAKTKNIEHLQLVTWNDFGEGTVIEPTLEEGFKYLEILQAFTGVAYTRSELELIHEYYVKKVAHKNDAASLDVLNDAFKLLCELKVADARALIEQIN
jgi:glycoprotein endo-alpha-1,2-mannosidase